MKKIIYSLIVFLFAISILSPITITMAQGDDYQYIMHDGDNTRLEYVPGEIIVKYKESDIKLTNSSDKNIINQKADVYNLQVNKIIDRLNMVILKTTEDQNINEIINFLKQDDDIEFVEPNYIRYLDSIPTNDTYRNNLRALHNYGQNVNSTVGSNDQDIDRLEAMSIFSGSNSESITGTIVAVIDNGVAYTHPDISNKMRVGSSCKNHNGVFIGGCIGGYDYYNNTKNPAPTLNSHGTHIAGTIAAEINNNKGIIGVNPNAKIMSLKVGEDQSLSVSNTINAINFAIQNGVKIINASYGSNTYSASEYNAILAFKNAGGLFITAAGNDANNNDTSSRYPCNYNLENIICVGATTQTGALASFSNYGATSVHVGAPGTNIYSSILGNKTTFFSENFESIVTPNIPTSFSSYGSNRTTKNNSIFYVEDGNLMNFGKSLFTNTGETYQDGMDTYIYSNTIDLSLAEVALFQFAVKCVTENGTGDVLKLEFSSDGTNFVTRTSITGGTTPTTYSTIWNSINNSYFTSNFKFRFHRKTDNNGQVGSGCWIDNINLITYYTGTHDTYGYMQGTSMATPHVVGLASLAWSFRPDLSYIGIKDAIINKGDYLTSLNGLTISSNRINAYNTLYDLDNFSPTAPILISPLSGANVTGDNINFLWSGATDIGVGISGYYYQLSTGNNFISPITGINIFTTGITIPITNTGTYYRRVRAFDLKNNTGAYSNTGIFTITSAPVVDITPPSIPVLTYPTGGIVLNTGTVNFLWNPSVDTGVGLSGYYYELLSGATTISGTVYTTGTTFNLGSGSYSWKVKAFDKSGNNSVFSNTGTFSITLPIAWDNTPDSLIFTPITNSELNIFYTSNIVTLTGINTGVTISVNTGVYSINGGAWQTAASTGYQGNTIQLALTSSVSYSTFKSMTLTYGTLSTGFNVTTKAFVADTTPYPVSFTAITNANVNSLYTSNIVTLTGINTGVSISVNTGMYSINGGARKTTVSTGYQGNTIQLALTSSVSFSTLKTMTLTYGTLSTGFNVTTQAQDITPNVFTFTSLTNQELNAYATGNTVIVSGINTGSQISIVSGEYNINGGAYVITTGTVYSGNVVGIRLLTPNAYLTGKTATLTIGGVVGTFTATTKPLSDTTPPSIPTLVSPVGGIGLNTGSVILLWSAATDTGVGMSGYYYQISTGSSMINILQSGYVSATGVNITLGSGSYYWKVKAIDLTGNQSAYSITGTFTITLPIVRDSSPDVINLFSTNNAELNATITSNIVSISGINTGITIAVNTGSYRINGGAWTTTTGTVSSGNTVQLQLTSANSYSTSKTITLTYGDKTTAFTVTTRALDSTPNTFTFTDVTNAELNTLYTSNIVTITGLENAYPFIVSISTGQLIKNSILIIGLTTGIQNGDTLSIMLSSSTAYSTQTNSIVSVGSGSDTYSVTTEANPSGGGGGGGGGGGVTTIPINTGVIDTGSTINDSGTYLITQVNTGNQNSNYSLELIDAYNWAYDNSVTTMSNINNADMGGNLLRAHMAKMMSNFAINILGSTPNTGAKCNFIDIYKQSKELQDYIKLSCQLGLMGINADGTSNTKFNPTKIVSRAEFGTALSRLIWGSKYNAVNPNFYAKHLEILKENGVMKVINTPSIEEIRGWVMLMMMRVDNKIKNNEIIKGI